MDEPTLNEALNHLAQHEPHYSVLVDYIKSCRESWVKTLCHSVTDPKTESQRDTIIGKIATYDDVLTIFEYRNLKQ